jgi:4-hydroxybenzoate polyprenyltransferase
VHFSAWLRLIRIPNTLTAAADILAGLAVVAGANMPPLATVLVCCGSIAIYWLGMIQNDLADQAYDTEIGRKRPLTTGEITRPQASFARLTLIVVSLTLVAAAALILGTWPDVLLCLGVAVALIGLVFAYNSSLKMSLLGPVLMGGCRAANLLLGGAIGSVVIFSIAKSFGGEVAASFGSSTETFFGSPHLWAAALGMGLYVCGFTIVGRREEETGIRRTNIPTGWLVASIGIGFLAALPWFRPETQTTWLRSPIAYWALIGVVLLPVIRRAWTTLRAPSPKTIPLAIRQSIFGIIGLDAAIAACFGGPTVGLLTAFLLLPTVLLGLQFRSS